MVERPYVVESTRMSPLCPWVNIMALMSSTFSRSILIAEVGACIYHYGGAILRYQKGRTQTFVVSVVRAAYRAFASHYRYAPEVPLPRTVAFIILREFLFSDVSGQADSVPLVRNAPIMM